MNVMNILRESLNPGWVSSLIGLVSFVAALWIYRASRIGVRPVYQRKALRLIGQDDDLLPDDVEIRFAGRGVERLTKTFVVFWNSGAVTLRGSDVVDRDPLRCDFSEGTEVLAVRIVKASRTINDFTASMDPKLHSRVHIAFDYLDPGDGATFEILHTDTKTYPDIHGTIRGVPAGVADWGRVGPPTVPRFPFPFTRTRSILFATIAFGVTSVVSGLFLPAEMLWIVFLPASPDDPARLRFLIVGLGVVYSALPIYLLWSTRRRFPRDLVTDELDL
jgi:hypothetical protein